MATAERGGTGLLAAIALLLLAAALAAPINHDESQYVAAIALMAEGLPYRDWPYLQTPLQPLLLAPLALLPAGWLLVAARLANLLFALSACWAIWRLLAPRLPFRAAALAVGGMATTDAFLFAAGIARNDALPAALLAFALLALMPGERRLPLSRAVLGGLCLGLAISAKISFALPAAGIGLWMLWRWRDLGWHRLLAVVAGGVAGLLPCLILYAAAPDAFLFGVFTYSLEAPQQFWSSVGRAEVLAPASKLGELGQELLKGATGAALLLWAVTLRRAAPGRRFLDFAVVGGLVAALLPDPFFRQYLVPALPPLFAAAGLALPTLSGRWRRPLAGAALVTAAVGVGGTVVDVARALRGPWPLAEAVQRGRHVRVALSGAPVVTLAPEQVAGRGVTLQPGFAAGPFLFRTSGDLARRTGAITGASTWQQLDLLERDPPAAILTGGERKPRPPLFPRGVDAPLDGWASAHGYRPEPLGSGWILWRRP